MEIDHEKVRNCFDPRFDSRLGWCRFRSDVAIDPSYDTEHAPGRFFDHHAAGCDDHALDRFSNRNGRSN